MKETIIREGFSTYLVIEQIEKIDKDYQVKMLLQNHITNIVDIEVRVTNGQTCIYYDVGSKSSLFDICKNKEFSYDQLVFIVENVISAIEDAKDYLLDVDNLLLSEDKIFWNIEKNELGLIYLPENKNNIMLQFNRLIKFLMSKTNHTDGKAVVYIYGLYRISSKENYSLNNIKRFDVNTDYLGRTKKEKNNRVSVLKEDESEVLVEELIDKAIEDNIINKKKRNPFFACQIVLIFVYAILIGIIYYTNIYKNKVNIYIGMALILLVIDCILIGYSRIRKNHNYEETNISLMGNQETTVLNVNSDFKTNIKIKLVGEQGKNEDLVVGTFPFVIGNYASGVNGYIKNKTISRIHANITENNGNLYLTDLDSTNGTYVNSCKIESGKPFEVKNGDKISFSNVKYKLISN